MNVPDSSPWLAAITGALIGAAWLRRGATSDGDYHGVGPHSS